MNCRLCGRPYQPHERVGLYCSAECAGQAQRNSDRQGMWLIILIVLALIGIMALFGANVSLSGN